MKFAIAFQCSLIGSLHLLSPFFPFFFFTFLNRVSQKLNYHKRDGNQSHEYPLSKHNKLDRLSPTHIQWAHRRMAAIVIHKIEHFSNE